MIVTVTANPSLDRTLEVEALVRGRVIRATAARLHPGGKGVNVARALVANGVPARAVLPAGGPEGERLLGLLEGLGLEVEAVPIGGAVRENVTVVEPDGTVTKLNAPGPRLSTAEVDALVEATLRASRGAAWVALCGTLPPGVPEDLYARLVGELRAVGVRVAVDSSGPALAAALAAGPDVVKPNRRELGEVVGRPLASLPDVLRATGEVLRRGVRQVLVSLGEAGAVYAADGVAMRASTPPVVARSTVGAGDAALAGFLAQDGVLPEALRTAVAWAAAAVALPGTEMPGPEAIDRGSVLLEELDGEAVEREGGEGIG
ncbi:MAG TPA: 1-phosphofructokinase [Actinomycetota bacterium]|nr:1-phosphofructokinase [Actinomycetota bacterium]